MQLITLGQLSEVAEFKRGRRKGSKNKYRKPAQEPEMSEDEKFKRRREMRQGIDTGLRASRELRGWTSLARAVM